MRKRITPADVSMPSPTARNLALETLADVEITSEDPLHPIEAALMSDGQGEWRAATPGAQTIRIRFDHPQDLRRIDLEFVEHTVERTQEYVLRWSPDAGQSFHEIVRQQWNFSPPDATRETESHRVSLAAVTVLELAVIPDIRGGVTPASLARLRLE